MASVRLHAQPAQLQDSQQSWRSPGRQVLTLIFGHTIAIAIGIIVMIFIVDDYCYSYCQYYDYFYYFVHEYCHHYYHFYYLAVLV